MIMQNYILNEIKEKLNKLEKDVENIKNLINEFQLFHK